VLREGALDYSVILSIGPADSHVAASGQSHPPQPITVAATTALDSAIMSIEVHAPGHPIGARHRFAVFSPHLANHSRIMLSDVVLFDGKAATLPSSEAAVLPLMVATSAVDRATPVGLFWESYGVRAGEQPEFELVMRGPQRSGFLRSLLESVGLASRGGQMITKWKANVLEQTEIGSFSEAGHALVVDFSSLRAGIYTMELKARVAGRDSASISRIVRIS
jgi:hypothetical protein